MTHVSDDALAETVGTTPARVRLLMTKFARLGFIERRAAGRLRINNTLLKVVLRD